MITEVSAIAFRRNVGEMLDRVQYRRKSIVINMDGQAVAALIDARLFERIRRMQERFDVLATRLADAYAAVPIQEGFAEVEHMAAEERAKSKTRRARRKKG